jgi:dTDP-4-amino-4,6-dideoxygalactose transaminase
MSDHKITVPFLNLEYAHKPLRANILNSIGEIIDSNFYISGKYGKKFEEEYANFNCVSNCISVGNGLDALIISLRCLEIGYGDEVLIPANTFIATALAVSYVGATPVLIEPDHMTYNIDFKKIEKSITKKTKAIIPVHLYGQACDMGEIMKLAQHFNLHVIEDNAQAQGALCNQKLTGSFGIINATSFYPGKNLGAMGDAGAITTNSDDLAKKAKMIKNYGSSVKYVHEVMGQNSRLDEFQAAVLIEKIKSLKTWTLERQKLAKYYDESLSNVGDIITPFKPNNVTHVYHLYVIRTNQRERLKEFLLNNGIETLIHYPIPIHLQNAYRELGHEKGSFPITELLAETSLSLPLYPGLSLEHQQYVIRTIKKFYNGH